jgi:CHU_C Type IX secretion signal domain/SprB repeat
VVCPMPDLSDATICSSSGLFNLTTLADPMWPNGTWSGVGVSGSNFNPINHLGSNTVTFTPTGACGTPATTTINVTSGPVANFDPAPAVCAGEPTSLFVNFTGIGPWSFTIRNNGALIGNYNTTDNPFEIPITLVSTGLITLTNLMEGTCAGANTSVNVPVASPPNGTLSLNGVDEICPGGSTTIRVSFAGGTAPYTFVYAVNGDLQAPITTNSNPFIFIVSPTEDVTYTLISAASGACEGVAAGSATVTLGSALTGTLTNGSANICQGAAASLTFNFVGNGPYTFVYSINTTLQAPITTNNPTYTLPLSPAAGSYTYQLVSVTNGGAACASTVSGTYTLTVKAVPSVALNGDATICGGSTPITFNFGGTGPYTVNYTINDVPQTPITTNFDPYLLNVSPSVTSIYKVTGVTAGGCPGTFSGMATVTIGSGVTSSLSGGGVYCQGAAVTTPVVINSVGTAPFTLVYAINTVIQPAVTTSNAAFPIPLPSGTGTFTYSLISANSAACPGTVTGTPLTITVNSAPSVVLTGDAAICGGSTPLSFNFGGTGPYTVNYTINTVAQTPITTNLDPYTLTVSPATTSTYTVTSVSASGGCPGIASGTATVTVGAGVTSSLSGGGTYCQGTPGTPVIINSVGTAPYSIVYSIDGVIQPTVNTSLAAFSIPLPTSLGSYTYALVSSSNAACPGTVTGTSLDINVSEPPSVALTGTAAICGGNTPLTFDFDGTGPFTVNYTINTVAQTPIVTNLDPYTLTVSPSNTSTYTVIGVSAGGCTGTAAGTATVTVGSVVSASLSGGGNFCQGSVGNPVVINSVGTGPFSIVYSINDVVQPTVTTSSAAYSIPLPSGIGTYEYKLVSISNAVCPGSVSATELSIVINGVPSATLSGTATLCGNSTTPISVSFVGNAPFTFVYTVNTIPQTVTTSDNPYILNVNPSANTLYALTSVSAGGCPGTTSGTAQVTVAPALSAVISGGGQACQGGGGLSLTVNFDGTGPYTFVYSANGVNQEITTSLDPYTLPVNPSNGTTYKLVSVTNGTCTGTVSGMAMILVFTPPTANLIPIPTPFCNNATTNVEINLTGTAPFTFVYAINGVAQAPITTSDDPYFIPANVNTTTTYTLLSLQSPGCTGTVSGTTVLTVNKAPSYANFEITCNASAGNYVIEFDVLGGTTPYTLEMGTGTFVGNHFTSTAIPLITPYNVVLHDANNCGDVVVSGVANCNCTTNAGTMGLTQLDLCQTANATATFNNNQVLEPGDVLKYILHTNAATPVGTILAWSNTPTFSFLPSMSIGTTYYISAIAGNPLAGNIDLTDICLSVAQGTPVQWHQTPALVLGAGDEICEGESAQVSLSCVGSSPFSFVYALNTVNQAPIVNQVSPFFSINLMPTQTTTISLVSIADKYCTSGTLDVDTVVTVNKKPLISNFNTICDLQTGTYKITFTAINGELPYTLTGVTGTWSGSAYTSNPIPIATPYSIILSDPNNCGQDTRSGAVNCSCATNAGTMSATPINVCAPASITAIFNGGQTVPTGSILRYILYSNPADPEGSIVAWSNTPTFPFASGPLSETAYYVSAVAGIPLGANIDLNDACTDVSNGTLVIWHNSPNINLGIDQTACQGETVAISVAFTGTMIAPPYSFVYQINGTPQPQVTGINTGNYTLNVVPPGDATITVTSVSEMFCTNNTPNESMSITIVNKPLISNLITKCDLPNNEYIVEFDIIQGVAPYTVTGLTGTIVGNHFTSNPILLTVPYNVVVKDFNDCGQDSRVGVSNCSCNTFAGSMNQSPLSLCVGEIATAIHDGQQELDPTGDLFYYILHTSPDNPIGNILAKNSTPVFDFIPGSMFPDVIYYISAIAGDADGTTGNILITDPCLSVATGTKVTWHLLPTAQIFDDTYDICPNQSQPITIFFTGKAPYMFNYLLNGVNTPGTSTNSSFTINTTLTQNSTFELVTVKDANGCIGTATGIADIAVHSIPVIMNVDIICAPDNLSYTVEFDVTNADTDDVNLGGSLQGFYDTLTGHFVSGAVPIQNPYTAIASDNWQCGLDSISGVAVCNCPTFAGTMSQSLISLCYGVTVNATPTQNPVLEIGDTLIYVLTKTLGPLALTTTYATNNVPVFTYNVTFDPDSIYYIVPVAGNLTPVGLDLGDPCLSISDGTPVKWAKPITGFLSDNQEICQGDTAEIVLHFEGGAPYTFNYLVNSNPQAALTINADSFLLKVSPMFSANYSLSNIVGLNGCAGAVSGGAALSVLLPAEFRDVEKNCDFVNSTYTVSFKITNGAAPNPVYTVTGITGTLTDTTFVSNPIPINQNYAITVTNPIGCSSTLTGASGCFCTTDAGTLNTTPVSACVTNLATVIHTGNFDLDTEDVLQYVLYTNPATFPQGIITVSDVPEFLFLSWMSVGTTYYVSAIAGDQLANGNVNPADPCLSLSPPVLVTFNAAPSAYIDTDTLVCEGENVIVPIQFFGTGPYTFVYALNGVSQFPIQVPNNTFSVSSTNILSKQTYTLVSVSNSSCPGNVSGTAVVNVIPAPIITLSGEPKVCPGVPVEVTLNMSGGTSYNVVLAQNPGSSNTFNGIANGFKVDNTLTQTTTFSVTSFVANGNNCEVKIGSNLTILVEDVVLSADAIDLNGFGVSCGGVEDGKIEASAVGGSQPYSYVWSNNQTGSTIQNLAAGPYSVTVTDVKGCTDATEVALSEPESISLNWRSQAPNCQDKNSGFLTIADVFGGAAPYKIKINDVYSQTSNSFPLQFDDLKAGNYTIEVEDANGCTSTENASIDNGIEVEVALGNDVTLTFGDSLKLIGVTNIDVIDTLIWTPSLYLRRPDSLITTTLPFNTVKYVLTVKDTAGCVGRDEILVIVRKEDRIYIPNVLNLGSTTANDLFTVYGGAELVGINLMRIYDRWGECVFEKLNFDANNPSAGWDGSFRDKDALPGVYVYVVELALIDGSIKLLSGDVTVTHK